MTSYIDSLEELVGPKRFVALKKEIIDEYLSDNDTLTALEEKFLKGLDYRVSIEGHHLGIQVCPKRWDWWDGSPNFSLEKAFTTYIQEDVIEGEDELEYYQDKIDTLQDIIFKLQTKMKSFKPKK